MHVADLFLVSGAGEGTAVLLLHERRMHQGQQVLVQARKHLLLKWHTSVRPELTTLLAVGWLSVWCHSERQPKVALPCSDWAGPSAISRASFPLPLQYRQGIALRWVCTPKGCLMPAPAKSQYGIASPCTAAVQWDQAGCGSWLPAALHSSPYPQGGRCFLTDGMPQGDIKVVLSSYATSIALLSHGLPMSVLQPKGQEGKGAALAPADGLLKPSISGDEEFTISLEEPRVMESNGDAAEPAG